jgi:N-acetylmuramoyl-L-alanine amidase
MVASAFALCVAPAVATSAAASSAPLIVVDPGHGGPFSNANANGLHERLVTLQIGLALRASLRARGYRVIMTRTTDRALQTTDTETWNLNSGDTWEYARDKALYYSQSIPKDDLTARTRVANTPGADLFISVHCNGAETTSAHGTETWASPRDAAGQALAKLVQPAMVRRTGFDDRGSHTADFYVLRWTNMPAILVESAFLTNKSDAAKLKTSATRKAVAEGIADGVDSWFATRPFRAEMPRTSAKSAPLAATTVSSADFSAGAKTVVLARSSEATDAPGVAALAVRLGASLLLSSGEVPSNATIAEIGRLKATQVILVGLSDAFDVAGTKEALKAAHVASAVTSIEAADRATLSAKIATRMGPPKTGSVLLANAKDDQAMMALAPAAARTGSPILLTGDTSAGACSAYLATQAPNIRRIVRAGSSRKPAPYPTAAKVLTLQYSDAARIGLALNAEAYTTTKSNTIVPIVVNTEKAADVLTASARAARKGQPVIGFTGRAMSPYTRLYITNRRVAIKTFSFIESDGSMPAILDTVLAKVDYY